MWTMFAQILNVTIDSISEFPVSWNFLTFPVTQIRKRTSLFNTIVTAIGINSILTRTITIQIPRLLRFERIRALWWHQIFHLGPIFTLGSHYSLRISVIIGQLLCFVLYRLFLTLKFPLETDTSTFAHITLWAIETLSCGSFLKEHVFWRITSYVFALLGKIMNLLSFLSRQSASFHADST